MHRVGANQFRPCSKQQKQHLFDVGVSHDGLALDKNNTTRVKKRLTFLDEVSDSVCRRFSMAQHTVFARHNIVLHYGGVYVFDSNNARNVERNVVHFCKDDCQVNDPDIDAGDYHFKLG